MTPKRTDTLKTLKHCLVTHNEAANIISINPSWICTKKKESERLISFHRTSPSLLRQEYALKFLHHLSSEH